MLIRAKQIGSFLAATLLLTGMTAYAKGAQPSHHTIPSPMPDASASTPGSTVPTGAQMVDALHTAFGDHHVRAVHAKGIFATGVFEPSPQAASLSKALVFHSHNIPVLLRFSDFTGIPDIPDNVGDSNPRGLALKFTLSDGSTTDVINHSFNGFPTSDSAQFRELLLAIGASGPGATKPTAIDRFLDSHPVAKTFLTTQKPPSESYTTLSYFGVNAFRFTDSKGKAVNVRYRFVPTSGEKFLSADQMKSVGPNYLAQELPARLAKGPVTYKWFAQVADESDALDDPSVAWPESRRLVELGTIRITGMALNDQAQDRTTFFRPLNVPDGISAMDPMLTIRQEAYPISFKNRQLPAN
ncbi:MAG: catalase family peroxidase [Luteimonas sp.]